MAPRIPARLTGRPLRAGRRGLVWGLRTGGSDPNAFSSERSFSPQIGGRWEPDEGPRGYYIDFRFKTRSPQWPPHWLRPLREQLHVAAIQWALGAYERYLDGDGDKWLGAAMAGAEHLMRNQHRGGAQDGGWRQFFPMPHTYRIDPPWLSAIAQGEGASLLTRLYLQTGDDRLAEAARRALLPMSVPVSEGGVLTELSGTPFTEEYPTSPGSFVLNGAIFALWGYRDVGTGLGDAEMLERFEVLASALATNLHRWDTGSWSRYDLYPHPIPNVASRAYHLLHIRQLEVLERILPNPELAVRRKRFQDYRDSDRCRRSALAKKAVFRVLVPRNAALAQRLPWNSAARNAAGGSGPEDVLVLCYHAVSEAWEAPLAVTPEQLAAQLDYLARRGFRGVTFADAMRRRANGRRVAITFDDGYRSVAQLAKPLLDAHGMPGTVFVPTSFIGTEQPMAWRGIDGWLDGPHAKELMPMSWEETRALAEQGWEIGSHTRSHPQLTKVDDMQLRAELEESRTECERRLGRSCESVAYPYGDADVRVTEAAMAAGYSGAAAVVASPGRPSRYRWPRVGVYRVDDERSFRLKTSRPLRTMQRSPGWATIASAIRPLRPSAPTFP